MAENRESENFALGLIVAAIVFFLFRRQLDSVLGVSGGRSSRGGGNTKAISNGASGGGCGCGGGCGGASTALPTNPGISIGNQSYNKGQAAFDSATVAAAPVIDFFRTKIGS